MWIQPPRLGGKRMPSFSTLLSSSLSFSCSLVYIYTTLSLSLHRISIFPHFLYRCSSLSLLTLKMYLYCSLCWLRVYYMVFFHITFCLRCNRHFIQLNVYCQCSCIDTTTSLELVSVFGFCFCLLVQNSPSMSKWHFNFTREAQYTITVQNIHKKGESIKTNS
jgi:hypothetical protein